MQDFLIVVDMQEDFIDGTLGTEEAQKIVVKVREKIEEFGEKSFTPGIPMRMIIYGHRRDGTSR